MTTDKKTRTIKLNGVVQLLLLASLSTTIAFFAIRYNKYKNYNNYAVLLEENEKLRKEQNELKEEFKEYDKKIEKINEYLNAVKGTNGVADDKNKKKPAEIKTKNRDFVPVEGEEPKITKAEMVAKLDGKMQVAYQKLGARKAYIAQAVKHIGLSNISYNKIVKTAEIVREGDEDAKNFVSNVIDEKYVGGTDDIVKKIKVVKSEPFIRVSNKSLNNANFYNEMKDMVAAENIIKSLPFGAPTNSDYRITSTYGLRKNPFDKVEKRISLHSGIDMVLGNNDVLATKDGVVKFAGVKQGYGKCVDIEHMKEGGRGSIITHYAHLEKLFVEKGQVVNAGDRIGIQGNTGRSTGKHLHYEIRVNNKAVNPYKFINGDVIL